MTWNAEVNGSLVAYEIPDDFRFGEYTVHMLRSGFNSRSGLFGGGSPGTGEAFYPTEDTSGKPSILLSGDDEGTAYLLEPTSSSSSSWAYSRTKLVDEGEGQIIGKISVADVDGDGYKEFFIPSYFEDKLYIYTFAP